MKILQGNIWDWWKWDLSIPICVTTNGMINKDGHLVMGAGIAKDAKNKCISLAPFLGQMVKWYGNKPIYVPTHNIISFPTKYNWKDNSDIKLIKQSAQIIKEMIKFYGLSGVISPWPGCSNGGLTVEEVQPILENIWDSDKFWIVDYKNTLTNTEKNDKIVF